MAILASMGIFIVVDMILGLAIYGGLFGGYSLLMGPLGGGFSGIIISAAMGWPIAVNGTMLILDIMIPVVCGIIAGVIARGSSGRGFIAGLSGVAIGYFIMFLLSFLAGYIMASQAQNAAMGALGGYGDLGYAAAVSPLAASAPLAQMMPGGGTGLNLGNYQLISLLVGILVIPIILGIFGGIGGGLLSAVLATPEPQSSTAAPTTMFIQSSQPPSPVIVGGYQPPAQPQQSQVVTKVVCPACKTQNDSASTFCQSCGTRLRS
jgi:hypothetical protein